MRNDSLEIIQQKTKENDDLIITCYDLISAVEKSYVDHLPVTFSPYSFLYV